MPCVFVIAIVASFEVEGRKQRQEHKKADCFACLFIASSIVGFKGSQDELNSFFCRVGIAYCLSKDMSM